MTERTASVKEKVKVKAKVKVSAILLAAGLSRRMGTDKLLLPVPVCRAACRGETLLRRALTLLEGLPVFEKILVTTEARLASLAPSLKARPILNGNPEAGQSGSVRLGVRAARGDMYFFLAADQPRLTPEILRPFLTAAETNPDKIIYPTVNGNPCTPALFPARFRDELLSLTGDTGGSPVRKAHPEACLPLEATPPEYFTDIDVIEDYHSLLWDSQGSWTLERGMGPRPMFFGKEVQL